MYIPGKGLKPRERYDVSLLKVPATTVPSPTATVGSDLPATSDSPVLFPSGFISPNSTTSANAELTQGTLGMDSFQAEPVSADAANLHEEIDTPPVILDTYPSPT